MGTRQEPAVGAIELGRDFFHEVVRPAMERGCPRHLEAAACGRFGMGSECLGMDDAVSRDHHWGPKVDLAPAMVPLIDEATADGATWERRFEIMQTLHELLDRRMVELGLVRPHPRFKPHATSGYRLLEWCYRDLLHAIPRELFTHVPVWDQQYFEAFTTGYVADLTDRVWQDMLHLEEAGDTRS